MFLLIPWSRSFPEGPAFVHYLEVGKGARRRHRISLPAGHALPLRSFAPPLRWALGWTNERLAELLGELEPITPAEGERIHAAMLGVAREFGPPPGRPAHARPTAPGRRHLMAGQSAARGSQGPNTGRR